MVVEPSSAELQAKFLLVCPRLEAVKLHHGVLLQCPLYCGSDNCLALTRTEDEFVQEGGSRIGS